MKKLEKMPHVLYGEPLQGDFDCQVILTNEEKENMGDNIDLIISPDNNDIGGCSDLTDQRKKSKTY